MFRRQLRTSRASIESLETRLCLSLGFSPPIQTPLGSATLMAAGDFNRDDRADLLVRAGANATTAPGVRLFLGLGDGTFSTQGTAVFAGPNVSAMVVGDFNEDGRLDAAFANDQSSGTVSFAFGRGDGTFGPINPTPVIPAFFVGANPNALSVGDFNGDQNLDLLISNGGAWAPPGTAQPETHGAGLLLGNGDGSFQPVRKLYASVEPTDQLAAGDIDNDADVDAVLTGKDLLTLSPVPRAVLYVLRNDGNGAFTATRMPFLPWRVSGLNLGDMNGDNRADLAALQVTPTTTTANGPATLNIFLSGNSGFHFVTSAPANVTRSAGLAAADFDRDGRLDFAVSGIAPTAASNVAGGVVSVIRGLGDGMLAAARHFRTQGPPLAQIASDVNGDGRIDILTGSGLGVSTLLNASTMSASGADSRSLKLLDEIIELTE